MAESASTPPGPSRIKRIAFSLVAMSLGTVVALVLLEGLLRLSGWVAPGFYDPEGNPATLVEAGAHGGAIPAGVWRLRHPDFDVLWKNNVHGFREREPRAKEPGTLRIGVLGDSIVAGYGVHPNERFADLWFRSVQERMEEAELWNLSSVHTGTAHMSEILRGVGGEYDLDVIILALFSGNELEDNLAWYRHHSEAGARNGTVKEVCSEENLNLLSPSKTPEPSPAPSGPRAWIRMHSRLALFLWVHGLGEILNHFTPRDNMKASFIEEAWPCTSHALDRFRADVGPKPMVLWYLPTHMEWDDALWERVKERRGIDSDDDRHRLRDLVRSWAEENLVPFVDATPWLLHREPAQVKFPIDGHFNINGNRLVADGLVASSDDLWDSTGKR